MTYPNILLFLGETNPRMREAAARDDSGRLAERTRARVAGSDPHVRPPLADHLLQSDQPAHNPSA